MASASGVLYIGVTGHLERRVAEHKAKSLPGFSRQYNTTRLVYFEAFRDVRAAIAREKQWKGWRREKKVFLIELMNPRWQDLGLEFHHEEKQGPGEVPSLRSG
jgi:putative endonuclease